MTTQPTTPFCASSDTNFVPGAGSAATIHTDGRLRSLTVDNLPAFAALIRQFTDDGRITVSVTRQHGQDLPTQAQVTRVTVTSASSGLSSVVLDGYMINALKHPGTAESDLTFLAYFSTIGGIYSATEERLYVSSLVGRAGTRHTFLIER